MAEGKERVNGDLRYNGDDRAERNRVEKNCDGMPTVLRVRSYRFFFVSLDRSEPPHVHVRRENMVAKFWLEPVALDHFSR